MQRYTVTIEGIAPLLQHKLGVATQTDLASKVKQRAGQPDFTGEWRDTCYLLGDEIVQPAEHIWRAMVKAASNFKIKGKRGKTFKDLVMSAVVIEPDLIPHGRKLPEDIDYDPSKPVYIDVRPVRVQRSRVLRERLALAKGWKLSFDILVFEDDFPKETLQAILAYAGQYIGIGDYRPKFGRFMITKFEEA